MSLMSRVNRLERTAATIPPPGQLSLIVCTPVECDPDGRAAGVYETPGSTVVDVVYDGARPDPAVLGPLEARLAAWGRVLTADPRPTAGMED